MRHLGRGEEDGAATEGGDVNGASQGEWVDPELPAVPWSPPEEGGAAVGRGGMGACRVGAGRARKRSRWVEVKYGSDAPSVEQLVAVMVDGEGAAARVELGFQGLQGVFPCEF